MHSLGKQLSLRQLPPVRKSYDTSYHTSREKSVSNSPIKNVLIANRLRKEAKSQTKSYIYQAPIQGNIYEVKICFLSNYGDPNQIRCSAFDFFQQNNVIMKVRKCRLESSHAIHPVSNLFQGQLVKDSEDQDFVAFWKGIPIQIAIFVVGTEPPAYIRAWNSKFFPNENAKEITIHVGGQFANRVCLPIEFGINISTKINQTFLLPLKTIGTPRLRKGIFGQDDYGELPGKGFKQVRLEIIGFPSDSLSCGLNQIEIINVLGKRMEYGKDIQSINYEGCTNITSPALLFKKDKNTSDFIKMWCAKRESDVVSLIFNLESTVAISVVRIFNHNSHDQETRCCVTKGRLICDGDCVWRGRIKNANGLAMDVSKFSTNVWLSDLPSYKHKNSVFSPEKRKQSK